MNFIAAVTVSAVVKPILSFFHILLENKIFNISVYYKIPVSSLPINPPHQQVLGVGQSFAGFSESPSFVLVKIADKGDNSYKKGIKSSREKNCVLTLKIIYTRESILYFRVRFLLAVEFLVAFGL